MTQAYKCDKCGEFHEQTPEVRVRDMANEDRWDLCRKCFNDMMFDD